MWEIAVVFCLCSLSLVSAHSRKFTTPNVTRLTDQFSKIAIENGFSRRFGAHNIQVNGSLAKLTLDKSSGNKNLHCSVFNILFPRLFIFLMIKPEFLSVYYPQNLYIYVCEYLYIISTYLQELGWCQRTTITMVSSVQDSSFPLDLPLVLWLLSMYV